MNILGLHNAADSGVCLMKDGVVVDAISEERFNRKKLFQGWPEQSLAYVLGRHSLTFEDIDYFAYGWLGRTSDGSDYVKQFAQRFAREMTFGHPGAAGIISERVIVENDRDDAVRDEFERRMLELGILDSKILYLDHHLTHAWSAYSYSPYEEALVFTLDGRGDRKSGTVSIADPVNGVREIDYLISAFDGLGFLYGQVTHYLGYQPCRHEGKVTGLAAHGNPDNTLDLFNRMVTWDDDSIRARIGLYKPFYTNLSPELAAEFGKHSREDLAAGVQKHCEDLIARWVSHWMVKSDRPDVRNVCLAGGIFANVRINQVVGDLPGVDNVYVFPHMGDGGLPMGAVAYTSYLKTGRAKYGMETAYLGPSYSNADIEKVLSRYSGRIEVELMNDKVNRIADDLRNDRVVGYFDNRMEYGPRALGARSMMYHARDNSVNEWLNKRLSRTEFMPFAPVTPQEYAAESYIGWQEDHVCAHFMTKTYDCTEAFKKDHPAVSHIDGTARPQIVTREMNGDYYSIVKAYCDATGDRAVINTSFNRHEEPIVCSPEDAIESLLQNTSDVLSLGDYRVTLPE
jgi:carbamoyltransferase